MRENIVVTTSVVYQPLPLVTRQVISPGILTIAAPKLPADSPDHASDLLSRLDRLTRN